MDRVHIFDTTLRDGEQSPGFSMNVPEKVRMARQLETLGVDVIEAGFPIASPGDFEGVAAVAREIRGCRVAALSRTRQADLDAALDAISFAAHPRLHIFLATSDLHLHHKLRMSRQDALNAIRESVRYGRSRCAEVEFSAEDGSRSDIEFLCEAVQAAVDSGATIINLPDTVGFSVPQEYSAIFRRVREHLGDQPGITLSAHCHNDLGLAVANSLAAIDAGARQVECTINGIGERAGNASLEELAVALAVRQAKYGVSTGVVLKEIFPASQLLTEITGTGVAPNKAVVGANAFAHEAGIHQDGIIKNPLTYEIISPEAVGVPKRNLVLGKHSGRNAVRLRLAELGHRPNETELDDCYCRVMKFADANKSVSDRSLLDCLRQARLHREAAPLAAAAPN
ncbi:MAG TPA: 2-isopropylmalate synthase [Candidatus Acidoferrales bacterium]|nr:2-isopropylmalate synthase [Candidatus Acidoferrales bacterium]